jgi:hypothetical protein
MHGLGCAMQYCQLGLVVIPGGVRDIACFLLSKAARGSDLEGAWGGADHLVFG